MKPEDTQRPNLKKVGPEPASHKPLSRTIADALGAARDVYEGIFIAPYRSAIYGEYLRQRDMFFVLGLSDLLGVPNPVAFYTLELYPEVLEHFHAWHLRLGLNEPPEGGFRCC